MSSTFKLTISSTEDATNYSKEIVFDLEEKLEETFTLTSASKTIDFSYIDDPTMFLISADNPVTVTIVHNANTIEFLVDSIYSAVFDPAFASAITSLIITEANGTATAIQVCIYGYTST